MSHILNKYPTDWTNTPHIEQIPHRLNKCLSIFVSYINIRQIYFNISCAFYGNCLWFPLQSFWIWNSCFNISGRYIGSSWNGTFKTSFKSDELEFVCDIFKRNVNMLESGSNIYGRNIISIQSSFSKYLCDRLRILWKPTKWIVWKIGFLSSAQIINWFY